MAKYNYKSDLPPILITLSIDGAVIDIPDCDFLVRFYIEGDEGRHYDCSHTCGVWKSCEPSQDGKKLICYLDNHNLGTGDLCAEFHYIKSDKYYDDGAQKSVVIADSGKVGIELVDGNGTLDVEFVEIALPFIYRDAYNVAKDHGYTGTAEDFYKALASVVDISNAEAGRVQAEITRQANEQERLENEDLRKSAEAGRVQAEITRQADFEKQKLDLSNKVSKSGDTINGDLIFSLGTGVVLSDESGNTSVLYQDEEDSCPRMQTKSGDIFLFRRESAPMQGSDALVSSDDLFKSTSVLLASMGIALDNVGNTSDTAVALMPSAGELYYVEQSKHIFYKKTDTLAVDLGTPSDKHIYCNAFTKLLYVWKGNNWSQVGGDKKIDAYTKAESDAMYAKLKDANQRITAYDVTSNMVTTPSLWLTDESGDGIVINKADNRINVEGDLILTDAQIEQSTGTKQNSVMSQEAVTSAINTAVNDKVTKEDFNDYAHEVDETLQNIDSNLAFYFLGNMIDFSATDFTLADSDVRKMQSLVTRLLAGANGKPGYVNEAVFGCQIFSDTPDGLYSGVYTARATMCYIDTDMGYLHFIFCMNGKNYHLYTENAVSSDDTTFKFKLVKQQDQTGSGSGFSVRYEDGTLVFWNNK